MVVLMGQVFDLESVMKKDRKGTVEGLQHQLQERVVADLRRQARELDEESEGQSRDEIQNGLFYDIHVYSVFAPAEGDPRVIVRSSRRYTYRDIGGSYAGRCDRPFSHLPCSVTVTERDGLVACDRESRGNEYRRRIRP